ncbi:MAG: PilZ domain-containing protein [Desulfuromonas sp.]|nr:PilZ domain-containing protein [Desulfuromonas sp.]
MTSIQEKRHAERFMIETPVMLENGTGMSRDISESGIYFMTDQSLTPGGIVRFSVKLDHLRPGKAVRLDCQGQVLRIEPAGERFGVAAKINDFWVN